MIATIVKHQWFSGSPLPLNEWFGRNHWYQWFFNGFWSINHWPRWFFSLATIGLDGFAMVFGLATIGLNGFSMVANHWSNDGMVTIHRYGLPTSLHILAFHFHNHLSWTGYLTNKTKPIFREASLCWVIAICGPEQFRPTLKVSI